MDAGLLRVLALGALALLFVAGVCAWACIEDVIERGPR